MEKRSMLPTDGSGFDRSAILLGLGASNKLRSWFAGDGGDVWSLHGAGWSRRVAHTLVVEP